MDWKRKRQVAKLVDGILEVYVLNRPPIQIVNDIMKKRGIYFEELDENDDEFCGIYLQDEIRKIIFVNANMYHPRKNFTIAHELGHHFLAHPLDNGMITCDKEMIFGNNKPESEKEADYFAICFLSPEKLVRSYIEKLNIENEEEIIKHTAEYFKVSKEAMGYRLEELNIIQKKEI